MPGLDPTARRLALILALLCFGVAGVVMTSLLTHTKPSVVVAMPPPFAPQPAPPEQGPAKHCIGQEEVPFYYANLRTKENPTSFGPPAEPYGRRSAQRSVDRLISRLCGTSTHGGDRRLFTALRGAILPDQPDSGANWNPTQDQWATGLTRLLKERLDLTNARVVTLNKGRYYALDMTPRSNLSPKVGFVRTSITGKERFLEIPTVAATLHDNPSPAGRANLLLRLKCGFQPYIVDNIDIPIDLVRSG